MVISPVYLHQETKNVDRPYDSVRFEIKDWNRLIDKRFAVVVENERWKFLKEDIEDVEEHVEEDVMEKRGKRRLISYVSQSVEKKVN